MTDTPPPAPPQPEQRPAVEREDRDVNLRVVLGFGGALFVVAVAAHLVLAWLFFDLLHREDREKRSQFPLAAPERGEMPQTTFGAPVAGALPSNEPLEHLNLKEPAPSPAARNAEDDEKLKSSGEPGAPRIPIEQAMRLVAEKYAPKGHEPAPVRYDAGIPGTGGGSNSGRDIPEGRR